MKLPVWILAIAILGLSATSSVARTHILARSGAWRAFGGTAEDGHPVCGMSSSGHGKYFGLKYFAGDRTLTVQLGNSAWTLKNRIKVRVRMQFDRATPWRATATGMHFSGGDAGLQFSINRKQLRTFMRELAAAETLTVSFPGEDVSDWHGSLAGSDTISRRFARCLRNM